MDFLSMITLAVGLGMDAMSVSAAIGVKWNGVGQKLRLAWCAAIFQFAMPLIGYALGQQLAGVLQQVGTYIAAALVFGIGAKMLWEALRSHPGAAAEKAEHYVEEHAHLHPKDPTRGWSLIALSIATSLDALVAGFSLGVAGKECVSGFSDVCGCACVIGITAGVMSLAGVMVGQRAGDAIGKPAEMIGAVVLMLLGVSFLIL